MSTDAGRIDFAAGWVHMGWVAIVQVSIMLTILLINIGPSALAGFGLLVVAGPSHGKSGSNTPQKATQINAFHRCTGSTYAGDSLLHARYKGLCLGKVIPW